MAIPQRASCCVSIPLCSNLNMPHESTTQSSRSCNSLGILIPCNTWFMCTTGMRVGFAFHSYIPAAENIEAKEKEQKGNSKGF